jgi:hypothetical protein
LAALNIDCLSRPIIMLFLLRLYSPLYIIWKIHFFKFSSQSEGRILGWGKHGLYYKLPFFQASLSFSLLALVVLQYLQKVVLCIWPAFRIVFGGRINWCKLFHHHQKHLLSQTD